MKLAHVCWILTSFTAGLLSAGANAQVIPIDDFDDGDDQGWSRLCSCTAHGCVWDANSGSYFLGTTDKVPAQVFCTVNSFWDASGQPAFSQGRLRAIMRSDAEYANPALVMRWDAERFGGYVFLAEPIDGTIAVLRIDGNMQRVLAMEVTPVRAGQDWMYEAGAIGEELSLKVWPVGQPEPSAPQILVTDPHDDPFTAGLFGIGVAHPVPAFPIPGHPSRLVAWFDNISFTLACPADFNLDGSPNSQDFFDFLAAFFALAPRADFNADGSITSQDFFDFLTAFFAGCP